MRLNVGPGLLNGPGVATHFDGFVRPWGTEPSQLLASPWIQGAQQARGIPWSDIRANAERPSSSTPLVGPQAIIASPWISMQDSAEVAGTPEGSPWSTEPQQSSASPWITGVQQSMATPWVTGAQQSSGSPWVVGTQQLSGTPWVNPPSSARNRLSLPQQGIWSIGPQLSSASPWIV